MSVTNKPQSYLHENGKNLKSASGQESDVQFEVTIVIIVN